MPSGFRKQAQWFSDEVVPHERALRAWLRKNHPHSEVVDDIIQDAYLKLLRVYKKGDIKSPKALLFRTAKNLLLDHLKSHRVSRHIPYDEKKASVVLDTGRAVPETVSRRQELDLLENAILSLPPRCREVMILHEVHGLPQKEVAQRLGVTASLVSNQLSIGLRKCRAYLRTYRQESEGRP